MRQLITRIDERLHEALKFRAAAEGRSVNALVTELLSSGLAPADERSMVRARAESRGLMVTPRPPRRPPSRDAAISGTKGAGRAASEALEAERARRSRTRGPGRPLTSARPPACSPSWPSWPLGFGWEALPWAKGAGSRPGWPCTGRRPRA